MFENFVPPILVIIGFVAQFALMFCRPRFEWRALIPLFTYLALLGWALLRAYEIVVMPYDEGAFIGTSGQWTGLIIILALIFLAAGTAAAAVLILLARLIRKLKK